MEKLVRDKEGLLHRYCTPGQISEAVEDLEIGFIGGTTLGLFYNFVVEGSSCGFKPRFCSALAKSSSLGANLALLSLGYNLSRAAYFKYSGETPHEGVIPYQIHCSAIGGAVGFARHGLRPALFGALMATGMMSFSMMLTPLASKTR